MTTDDTGGALLDEELERLRWRTRRLTALGYDLPQAVLLAGSTVDIRELERLIAGGCPLGTAVRIAA
jgi:hypothetical protein